MPTEIEHEGKKYILKSDVDDIITSRVSEVSAKRREAEARAVAAERELENAKAKLTEADGLGAQITDLRAELAAANARYDRHSQIAAAGITDPDVRDAIEWAYERTNGRLPKKDQRSLEDTLAAWAEEPDSAPASVRHHFAEATAASGDGGAAEGAVQGAGAGAGAGGSSAGEGAGGTATGGSTATGAGAGAGGRTLPKAPKQAATKPSPVAKPLTLDAIYGAKDGQELDAMIAQFKGATG